MIALQILSLLGLSMILALSTGVITASLDKVIKLWGLDSFFLSGLIVALGTSLPELAISVDSALKGNSNLALGNILGSNIANISIIVGGAVLIAGSLSIPKRITTSEIYYAFLISAAPLIFLSDGQLSRTEGAALVSLYIFWQVISFKTLANYKKGGIIQKVKGKFFTNFTLRRELAKFILGLTTLLISAEVIIKTSTTLAYRFSIPEIIIGIFILGAGSSLPELTFGISGIKNKKEQVVMGDILGSLVTNSSLILGITCLISPVKLFYPSQYLKATLYFLTIFLIFYLFIRSKNRLEKWEGAFLVAAYIALIIIEIP